MISPGQVPLAEALGQTWLPLPRCSCFAWAPQRPPTGCTAHLLTTSSSFQPPILHIGNPSHTVASFKGQDLGEELLWNTGGNRAFTHKTHVHTQSRWFDFTQHISMSTHPVTSSAQDGSCALHTMPCPKCLLTTTQEPDQAAQRQLPTGRAVPCALLPLLWVLQRTICQS